jgi:hypothetical protein
MLHPPCRRSCSIAIAALTQPHILAIKKAAGCYAVLVVLFNHHRLSQCGRNRKEPLTRALVILSGTTSTSAGNDGCDCIQIPVFSAWEGLADTQV